MLSWEYTNKWVSYFTTLLFISLCSLLWCSTHCHSTRLRCLKQALLCVFGLCLSLPQTRGEQSMSRCTGPFPQIPTWWRTRLHCKLPAGAAGLCLRKSPTSLKADSQFTWNITSVNDPASLSGKIKQKMQYALFAAPKQMVVKSVSLYWCYKKKKGGGGWGMAVMGKGI